MICGRPSLKLEDVTKRDSQMNLNWTVHSAFRDPAFFLSGMGTTPEALFFGRLFAPALLLGLFLAAGRRLIPSRAPLSLKILAGSLTWIIPIYITMAAEVQISRAGLVGLGFISAVLLALDFKKITREIQTGWRLDFLLTFLFFTFLQIKSEFPVSGDPLAFVVHAKQLLLGNLTLSEIDPRQRTYPDFFVVILAVGSSLFRLDPIQMLLGFVPFLHAAFISNWRQLSESVFPRLRGTWLGLVLPLFCILAVHDPFRTGVQFGRYPYELATLVALLWWRTTIQQNRVGSHSIAILITGSFLSHPAWITGLFIIFTMNWTHRRTWIDRLDLLLGSIIAIILSAPRLAILYKNRETLNLGPEVTLAGWSSVNDTIAGLFNGSIGAIGRSLTSSPVVIIVVVPALIYFFWNSCIQPLIKSEPKINIRPSLAQPLLFAWVVVALASSGLTESLKIAALNSHYSRRLMGVTVAFTVLSVLYTLLIKRAAPSRALQKIQNFLPLLLSVHLLYLISNYFIKESRKPDEITQYREGFVLLQTLSEIEKQKPGSVTGLLSSGGLERDAFFRNNGAGYFFPYFFSDKKPFLSFVPSRGMSRDYKPDIQLQHLWQVQPTNMQILEALKYRGINWILIFNPDDQFKQQVNIRSDLYQEVFTEGAHLLARIR